MGREGTSSSAQADASSAYGRVEDLLAAGRCVVLDGGVGTELPGLRESDDRLWGVRAILEDPDSVRDVHRRYVEAGCDVISTNTWGLPSGLLENGPRLWQSSRPVHWMDVARRGVRLAREAAGDRDVAVAFSLNGDVDTNEGQETIRLLTRAFRDDPPDLILVETLSLVRPSLYDTIERLLDTGIPVWLSFRRCRHGLCGVYGEHWGGPEGDAFGRAARRFEEMGVGALLVNCIPPDHVDGMVSFLRDFTDLPLGVYPNLGYLTSDGWQFAEGVGGDEYASMALRWREEGAQIIGGCCGVTPDHLAAARVGLQDTLPGRRRLDSQIDGDEIAPPAPVQPWADRRGRTLFPIAFPDLVAGPGVFPPHAGSFLAWRYLYAEGIGAHQRCLDVGSGTGILGVQLALNGAAHVHCFDIDDAAVNNTRDNAFRNGVSDRLTAARVDLYPWVPEERYEVIVASLFQIPADPFERISTHRPVDYWGRNAFDQLLTKLSRALAPEGVAYLVQLSILSQQRTSELLEAAGFEVTVVDYDLYNFPSYFTESRPQIDRVEELSDAYHVQISENDVLVAYLLEVRRRGSGGGRSSGSAPWSDGGRP
jgi:S-methylmethionine-dependent homocysteine/selenocysteine methylase/SAM-dependent methyltransferase